MTRRKDFIALARLPGANVSELCRRFGIGRKSAYKWLRRHPEEGAEAMADRSRRPQAHPRTTAAEPVAALLALRAEQPTWGPRKLSVWLRLLGVRRCHGRPFHPQTQGKDERFHRTLKADLLARRDWTSLAAAQPRLDAYRHLYNHQRPHQALADQVPASRYQPSRRAWQAPASDFAYGPEATVRRVKAKGEITFQNRFFYLGQAFRTYTVGLVPTAQEGVFAVHFHAYVIGQIDLCTPNSKAKGSYYPMAKPTDIL